MIFLKKIKNRFLIFFFLIITLSILALMFWIIEHKVFNQKTVSILMYHVISENKIDSIYQRTKKNFIKDLEFIKRKKYNVISFNDLINNEKIENNSIIITFDDMDLSQYYLAFPFLKSYNLKATFFVPTNLIKDNDWKKINEISNYKNNNKEKLFYIESHSHEHKALSKNKNETKEIYYTRIYNDLLTSTKIIREQTNVNSSILALPYGAGYNNSELKKIAKNLNFKGIRTSKWGNENLDEINWYKMNSWPILSHTSQLELQIFIENRRVSRFFMRIYKKMFKLIISNLADKRYLNAN